MIVPCKENTCAVIVTFFPKDSFKKNLELIREQVGQVIIVDNASSISSKEILKSIPANGIHFIWNDKNLGVATALNQGCQYAIEHHYAWVITFDQDTSINADLMSSYSKFYLDINDPLIAIIGCNYIDSHTNKAAYQKNAGWEYRKDLITSGSLILLQAYQKVAGFRDAFFIDEVDYEFCRKCCRDKFRIIILFQSKMFHSIGKATYCYFFGFKVLNLSTNNHPPFRLYFITRNQIVLFFENIFTLPFETLNRFCVVLKFLIFIILFEHNTLDKLYFIFLGVKDAFLLKKDRYVEINQTRIPKL